MRYPHRLPIWLLVAALVGLPAMQRGETAPAPSAEERARAKKDVIDLVTGDPFTIDRDWLRQQNSGQESKSLEELQASEQQLQKVHARYMRLWNRLQNARKVALLAEAAGEFGGAAYVMEMWLAAKAHDDELAAMRRRDQEAFYKKYPAAIYGVGMGMTRGNKEYEEWLNSPEHQQIWKAEELETRFRARLKELSDKERTRFDDVEKRIDTISTQFRSDYTEISRALSQVHTAIQRKKEAGTAPVEDPKTASGSLWLWSQSSTYEAVVGQTKAVWVKPIGGEGGYVIGYKGALGMLPALDEFPAPGGYQAIPLMFMRPGRHQVEVRVVDRKGNRASLTLTFNVAEPPKTPEKPAIEEVIEMLGPPVSPKPPKAPAVPPPPAPWSLKPFAGTFQSQFWCPGFIDAPGGMYRDVRAGLAPIPVTVTVNLDGTVKGRCSYTAPESCFSSVNLGLWPSLQWKTQFAMEGKLDWQTGRIELKIPQAVTDSSHEKFSPSRYRAERRIEYSATLVGWFTQDPRRNAQLGDTASAFSQALGLAPSEFEKVGAPNMVIDPAAKSYRYADEGWVGVPGLEPNVSSGDIPIKIDEMRYVIPPGNTVDNLKFNMLNKAAQMGGGAPWYLKLGPREPAESELNTMELVATAIWPDKKLVVKPGRAIFAQLMGVFMDQGVVVGPVDLSGRAEWNLPDGLMQTAPGIFTAMRPGDYEVTARVKRKDGTWMNGYLKITVAP